MEWQPIETAPKSESILVGRAPYYVDQAQWDDDTWMAIGGKCKTGNFFISISADDLAYFFNLFSFLDSLYAYNQSAEIKEKV